MKKKQQRLKKQLNSKLPKKSRQKLGKWFKTFLLILFVLGIGFWLRSGFWQIAKVDCHLNGDFCPAEVWGELMSLAGGKNILLFSLPKASAEIKRVHPEFFQVEIKKRLPQTLSFKIEIRKVAIAISQEDSFYLVDKEGVLLEKREANPDLPLIVFSGKIEQEVGHWLEDELLLKTVQLLYESKLRLLEPLSAQIVSARMIELILKNGLTVLFSSEKELKGQLDSLQFIFERAKIEGEKLKRIDLRFDKPVVVKS